MIWVTAVAPGSGMVDATETTTDLQLRKNVMEFVLTPKGLVSKLMVVKGFEIICFSANRR